MQRKRAYLVLCIFFFLFSTLLTDKVNAQSDYQTFQRNPITYWNTTENCLASYHANNTISLRIKDVADWYNSNWTKRQEVSITGVSGAGINYQVLITVDYRASMQSDFDDIRFTDNDGTTLLDYWLQEYALSSYALFWVEVKDSLESSASIYMYYSNPDVNTLSNGVNTFIIFDDFNDDSINVSLWDEISGTNYEDNGFLIQNDTAALSQIAGVINWTFAHALHFMKYHEDARIIGMMEVISGVPQFGGDCAYFLQDTNEVSSENDGVPQTTGSVTQSSTVWQEYSVYWYNTSQVDFIINEVVEASHSTQVPDENMTFYSYTSNLDTTPLQMLDWIFLRKLVADLSGVFGNEETQDIEVEIPLLDSKDIQIKTMVEQNSFVNNESIAFSLISDLGELSNLVFVLNETYDYRIRIQFSIKKALNIFRLILSDEYQVQIARYTETFIISKNILSLRIKLFNFTLTSKLDMFFMSGDLDYTSDKNWNRELVSDATLCTYHDSLQELTFHVEDTVAIQKQLQISYFRTFTDFQYIRTYLNSIFDIPAGSIDQSFIQFVFMSLFIGNIEIELLYKVERTAGTNDIVKGYITTPDDSLFDETLGFLTNGYDAAEDEYVNRFAIWRTSIDEIGISASSNTEVLRYTMDTRTDIEEKTTLVLKDKPSDWGGNITIRYTVYFKNLSPATIDITQTLEDIEYDFSSDYGIAEPTFSSTWWGIFPFNIISDWLLGTLTADWDIPEAATDFFEIFTGVGESVADFLSPYFGGVVDVLGNVWDSLVEVGSDIVIAVGAVFDNIAASVLEWGQDVIEWFIDALMGFASAIADFLVWFINGIGALLGITNLAGSIASVIGNFATAITSFLSGIVLVFTFILDGFSFLVSTITTYLPTALTFAMILVLLHVGTALASGDDTKIMNMIGVYARIFEKILGIFYSVANMVVQFIGGIIP